jgi:urease gamma subunit
VRLFVADVPTGDWNELTDGDQRTVRVTAPDLQHARRARARIRARGEDVAVILDLTVAVAGDFRSAQSVLGSAEHTVHYAGTVDGLAGLISDIARAEVADGVTLIAGAPRQDLRELHVLGRDVLHRLASLHQPKAS